MAARSVLLAGADERDLTKLSEYRAIGGYESVPKAMKLSPEKLIELLIKDKQNNPSNYSLGKLYSDTFYKTLKKVLKPDGLVVVQSTSPYYAKNSFWCVEKTLASVGFHTTPYHAYVPSFGDWGYVMGFNNISTETFYLPAHLQFYDGSQFREMLNFPKDMGYVPTEINRLNNQVLIHYFEDEWRKVQ